MSASHRKAHFLLWVIRRAALSDQGLGHKGPGTIQAGASGSGSGKGAGGGVSSSTEPSLPTAEEEPGDRSEIERALDELELAMIKEQKDRLAEQISPLIESEKARLVRRLWHHNLGELPSLCEMVEMIIDRFANKGIRGILLNRRNIPIMSMPIESMLLAVNSNFLVFSISSDDMMGQSFASLVPTVAAAESAIGLAIFIITFRVRGTIAVESINSIRG
ncbi:NADH-ubiquinone oxidoreductase chain 4L [Capsicum baccatum]|uniref:NADH-ubiquinone oxidoreductase chain 4L n=1 Tax=Capsicum baccatum TaxID=33114 RepID=A0A2G2V3B4_CAPBA|nr:NADH-ubiquinone oxidoreductase chain 4L [Capsicum baccatum]